MSGREIFKRDMWLVTAIVTGLLLLSGYLQFFTEDVDPLTSEIEKVDETVKENYPDGTRGTVSGKKSDFLASGLEVTIGGEKFNVAGTDKNVTMALLPNVDHRGEYFVYGKDLTTERTALYDSKAKDYVEVSPKSVEKVLELSEQEYEGVYTLGQESRLQERIKNLQGDGLP